MDKKWIQSDRRTFLKLSIAGAAAISLPETLGFAQESPSKIIDNHSIGIPSIEVIALNRMAFGSSPDDLKDFRALSRNPGKRLEHYIEQQLEPTMIGDATCGQRITAAHLPTLTKTLKQLWADHVVEPNRLRDVEKMHETPTPAQPKPPEEMKLRLEPARETEIATWIKAVYSKRQLQEVIADFWHNHFNVFAWDQQIAPVFVHYDRDVIRAHAFGNFREMLEAVTKSPAMLQYLDGFVNQSGNPNENFARELFELHTLGSENYLGTKGRTEVLGYSHGSPIGYVDGDVYEAARCFTGWKIDAGKNSTETGEFTYYDPWHDRFQKIVLGHALQEYQPAMKDGQDVLDLVAFHPGTSRHIARKLCRRLISDQPPEKIIEETAKVFRNKAHAPDQLKQVIRFVLRSEEFRTTWGKKMKRPFEAIAGTLRATGADFHPSEMFINRFQQTGQRLFQWRSPDGYPDTHIQWGGTTSILERWRLTHQFLQGQIDGTKIDLRAETPASLDTSIKIAEYWSTRILGRKMSRQSFKQVADFLSVEPSARLPSAVALVAMSPDFQWR